MAELSPSAQAVLDAAFYQDHPNAHHVFAAALRAAADQVVPHEDAMPRNLAHRLRWDTQQSVRLELLAIAAELEGQ